MGTILFYGSMDAGEPLEYILKENGYGIARVSARRELCGYLEREEVSLLFLFMGSRRTEGQTEEKQLTEKPAPEEEVAEGCSLELLAGLRQSCRIPILVKMAGGDEALHIMALNAGADDCIREDCSVLECLARVQAQLRCYRRLSKNGKQSKRIKMGGLEVDDGAKLVRVEGRLVNLTPTEYKILCLLMEKPGRVLSNRQIYESIWKMTPIGADNTIAVHIRHIREKIEENPQEPRYLRVVWGQGYKVG